MPASAISLSLQPDGQLLALLAGIGVARRLVGRRLEMGVAEAAIAAAGEHDAVAGLGQIGDQRLVVLIEDLRPGRHLQHHVGAAWRRCGSGPCRGRPSSP